MVRRIDASTGRSRYAHPSTNLSRMRTEKVYEYRDDSPLERERNPFVRHDDFDEVIAQVITTRFAHVERPTALPGELWFSRFSHCFVESLGELVPDSDTDAATIRMAIFRVFEATAAKMKDVSQSP